MSLLGIVNVRIPDDVKGRMESFPQLNWSEIIRHAIESRVKAEERRRKDGATILAAIKTQNRIAETLARRYKGLWKGTGVVRYWRAPLLVVDRSVAVKWFVKEPLRRKALKVR